MVAQPLASGERVLVSYTTPPAFSASPNWPKVLAALRAQLPLRNIHWKSTLRTPVRTIQELDVTLVPFENVRDDVTSQVPVTLLEKPLLNIYIVHCEDNDLDSYRTTVKKQIKDWHSTVTARKHQEWLILQIVRPDARAPTGNFFQIKGSVLDKLKADFNSDKRDRCVQVTYISGNENPLVWAEFFNKMKDGLLVAFESAAAQRQEEVKRSEGQQQMPGWNFCTFFILKESLAASYEGINLFEEALLQYEELELSFYQVWKERNMSWFGTLINASPNDDSLPLLDVKKKPYRDLILANTISVFDFRIYLLARQCELLAKLGRMNEVTSKVCTFLGAFGRRLREVEAKLPPFFVESWSYSSALRAVEQCDLWASGLALQGPKLSSFNAGKGELLELARHQLDTIGVQVQHLPNNPPFSTSVSKSVGKSSQSKGKISNAELLAAIDDKDTFYELYVGTSNRAIDMYAKSARRKFALKLHGSLAALDLHRGRLTSALTTYTSLPAHYAPHMWTSLESYMLSRALDTHAELSKAQDVEWIHILLAFLKTYAENRGSDFLTHEKEIDEYVGKLVQALRDASEKLENDLSHPEHPAVSVRISGNARIAETRDGSYVDVIVHNNLPCTLPADEVSIVLAGPDIERRRFSASTEGLQPGKTELSLFCPTPSPGIYLLDSSEVRMAKLLFQWSHNKKSAMKTTSVSKPSSVLVRIPQDPYSLDVRINQSNRIELGKSSRLMIMVSTGRNDIARITLRLSTNGISFWCQKAMLDEDEESLTFAPSPEAIVIEDIPKDRSVTFTVPHSDASAFQAMKVKLEVEYITAAEPSIRRLLNLARVLVTTLPITVNVEDFFRGTRLISKFTVATTSHQHVRIAAANLEAPEGGLDGLKITSSSAALRRVVTVTPGQPANFLFTLDSTNGPVRESLSLKIKYRMLREEVEALIEDQVKSTLADYSASQQDRVRLVGKLVDALERDAAWVDLYGITGELIVPDTLEEEPDLSPMLAKAKKLLSDHRHSDTPEGEWREIKIPVDVPYMNIVAAARIRITSNSSAEPLYAGQPIPATLMVHTSFHWGSNASDKDRKFTMRYNIEEIVRQWLVSGPKRGDFVAMDDSTYTVPITLIALHHGEFSLPKVSVTALPIVGEVTMGSMAVPSTETYQVDGAEKVLVLPRGGRTTFVVGMGSVADE